ncbi:MAG: TetR/AcrR family transcriptional regulator [Gammaproteobacteria bacterium]
MVKTVRLAPEERKQKILDAIAAIITKGRIADLSVNLITCEAGVSKALIYKYYPSITTMLEDLLTREYTRSVQTLKARLDVATNFVELLEVVVNQNFDECVEHSVLNTLRHHPDLQMKLKQLRRVHSVTPLLHRVLQDIYDIDEQASGQIIQISSGASYAAARYYMRRGGDRERHIAAAIAYIKGGTEALLKQEVQPGRSSRKAREKL